MTELFGGNYFSPAWPHPSTQTVFGGAQSLMGHKQSPIRSVIKVNWSLDFLKVLRFSFPVPVVWPSSLARFSRRKHIFIVIKIIVQFFECEISERVLITGDISRCKRFSKVSNRCEAKMCGLSLLAIFTFWVLTLWHIRLVLYSKRKSSITAPAPLTTKLVSEPHGL